MSEDLYEVRLDGIPYATDVSLEAAIALVEALFKKWFAEPNLAFEIRRITKSTNADRIRSMTDEELAEWFLKIAVCPCDAMNGGCALNDDTCRQAWLEWLKEEVKDDKRS